MFTVQPLCRWLILLVTLASILLTNAVAKDDMLAVALLVVFMWLYRYLKSLKITIINEYFIKETGKNFKRKNIIMLKNISHIRIVFIHPVMPSFIRLHTYNKTTYILGINGRQRQLLEKYILRLK